MVVYVDRNFKDIFRFFELESGWGNVDDGVTEPTDKQPFDEKVKVVGGSAEVSGPPGSGKSTAAFAALRYLSTKFNKSVAYVPLKSAAFGKSSIVALLMENFVITLTLKVVKNYKTCLQDVIEKLEPQCLFFDGFYHGMQEEASRFKDYCQNPNSKKFRVEFLGATTSMMGGNGFFDGSRKLESTPWDILDYVDFIRHTFSNQDTVLGSKRLSNLGCSENADVGEVIAAVERKFLVAGHSCRFMFDYSEDEIILALTSACQRVSSIKHPEESKLTVNTLIVKRSTKEIGKKDPVLIPVSLAAAVLMHMYGLLKEKTSTLFLGTVEAAKTHNWSMLGWHFELDAISRLKLFLPPVSGPSDATAIECKFTSSHRATSSVDRDDPVSQNALVDLMHKLSLASASTLETMPPFELVSAHLSKTFNLPKGLSFTMFEDYEHLVEIVLSHDFHKGPLCLCPCNYDNPFFDFIVVENKTSEKFFAEVIAVKEMNQRLAVEMRNQNNAHARKKTTMLTRRRKVIRNRIILRKKQIQAQALLEKKMKSILLSENAVSEDVEMLSEKTMENQSVIAMNTFQLTVSNTHSCDALVMHRISDKLYMNNVILEGVIHHAVLPSAAQAKKFRFKAGENLEKSQMKLRSSTAQEPSAKRKREHFSLSGNEEYQPLSKSDLDAIAYNRWTTVTVAEDH